MPRSARARPPAAAILAGGRSSRWGRDKARAPFHGATLLRRAAATLPPVAALALVAPRPYPEVDATWLRDPVVGAGPLAGVVAALRWSRAQGEPWLLVRACDLPHAGPELWRALLARRDARPAVVPRWPGGELEPLAALWHARALPRLEADLAAGRRSLHGALRRLGAREVPVRALRAAVGPRGLLNANRPADLARAAGALRTRSGPLPGSR